MKKSLKSSLLGIIITSAFTPAISIAQDFDWSGFYLGDFTRELSDSSSIYGLYAGYNFQKNNIVYGVELDYSTLSGSKDVQLDGGEGAVLGAG